ncbi:uncharacterized protein CC84DRAFT_1163442 [Paraphaeosphaeria sporulosa]|uniref:Uncharacterized protein n=1 Tax=Paraphaeosphaeria sporulosa TaxID=1460663 RepID=A0A177CI88_9PLEO|nr:uncharacterized protein CC84DRAFT_1163442 [Paraphaeosphaeria sporulosa]OAG07223.1 hypothetical protein CC84DRAFT_1163442 [Paraphaeosphaeria sporulosa]
MRVTRAASRAEHVHHADDDANDASIPHADQDRVPLGEVSANTVFDPDNTDAPAKKIAAKKGKAKSTAKKGAKGKKAKTTQEEEAEDVDTAPADEDQSQPAERPVSDAGVDERAEDATADAAQAPVIEEPPATSPSRPVRMTRRQLAKQEEDFSKSLRARDPPELEAVEEDTVAAAQEISSFKVREALKDKPEENIALSSQEQTEAGEEQVVEPQDAVLEPPQEFTEQLTQVQEQPATIPQENDQDPATPTVEEQALTNADVPEQDVGTPSLEVTEPEPKVLASEKPVDEAATPATSVTPSRAISRSSTRSASRTPMRLEESISAIDDLEEALENVGRSMPSFDQLADDKSPRKARFSRTASPGKPPRQTGPRTSMSPKVSRNPSLGPRSMKSTGLSRASSVRAPLKERTGSGETTDYLASKRRPISMTFAPPPPPAKSNKAPTTSDFQLPGERIAAELKAKKEERVKRMAEVGPAKARPISMPPPPKSTKPPTKSDFQLPGERIAAELKAKKEERLKRMAEGDASAPRQVSLPPPPKSSKPPTVPKFQLPGEKFAAEMKARKEERLKREAEEAEAAKKTAFKARPAPARKPVAAPVRQTAASQARERIMSKENTSGPTIQPLQRSSSVTTNKRASIVQARSVSTSSSNRNSVIGNPGAAKLAPADAVVFKNKGREVFNRDRLEKEARENERREKEEAAKRARLEAAERGRIASREWAKKQLEKRQGEARRARETTS